MMAFTASAVIPFWRADSGSPGAFIVELAAERSPATGEDVGVLAQPAKSAISAAIIAGVARVLRVGIFMLNV
jgi:hypothetical protein